MEIIIAMEMKNNFHVSCRAQGMLHLLNLSNLSTLAGFQKEYLYLLMYLNVKLVSTGIVIGQRFNCMVMMVE